MTTRRIKVAETTDHALDWLVAKAEGEAVTKFAESPSLFRGAGFDKYAPSTDWSQGGPIIEREGVFLWRPYGANGAWSSKLDGWVNERVIHAEEPLTAAMRCYVASKLGLEVEVPEELL